MNLSQLLLDYESKMQTKDIQLKYNLSWSALTKILKNAGVYKKMNSLRTSEDKLDYIKMNYFKESNKELSKKLSINEDWIRELAKQLGLPKKGSGWKYNLNIEELDYTSNAFYYFLGWIASDGNISKNFYSVTLKITDKDILEKFKLLFPTASIYHYPKKIGKQVYELTISSKQLALYINSKGITPNKGKTLKVVEELWNSHFVRGFFEGDGHIRNTLTNNGKFRYEAGFVTASEAFAIQLMDYLNKQDIHVSIAKEKTYFRLRINGKENVKKFYIFLYNNCEDWYLIRKKQIMDQLFSNE